MDEAYLSFGWDTTSNSSNSSGEGVDNAPTILYQSGGVNASQIIINLFAPRAGSNWRQAQIDNWDPEQPEPDENEVTAPEIPTHDEHFLSEEEDSDEDGALGELSGDEWAEGEDQPRRRFPPGYLEALEAALDDILAMATPDEDAHGEGEGYDSDTPWVEEIEDIADESRDGDEDASLDEA
ncbi:uncharacterized protein PGRI_019870 [Penicillium griseofulvum]|uniref:Uncharacterized protein n=1 Tax=Penicillium patulum TaxID=5078 RepID=A0A135LGK6_PENPA|nr:uncharacterized protein PGRI_019870 [Penicillium griseofulvum]KXG48117.1 hypothetical protein PGRI_019870 [Penicillium griseofulvum]